MNFFKRIKLYRRVRKVLRPFLKSEEKVLFSFEKIEDNHINPEIQKIYEEIVTFRPNKYKKEKERYKNYVDSVVLHNAEIDFVLNVVDSFDLERILFNPLDVSDKDLSSYKIARDMIYRYENYPSPIKKFLEKVKPIIDDFEEVCSEYQIHEEYEKTLKLSGFNYINLNIKRNILTKTNLLLSKLNRTENTYYPFERHKNLEEMIREYNEYYLETASKNKLFDGINEKSLDEEQRKSVLVDEQSVLVVAGAGSGKTLTICGKVSYLLEEEKVRPEDILLLSYSKKSAEDLQTKITKINPKLKVGTFHKIGLDILKEKHNKIFLVEDQYNAIIEAYFRDEMHKDLSMLRKIINYYALYLYDTKHNKKYEDEGQLYEDLKSLDFATLKNYLLSLTNDSMNRETIKKECVKSYEEMAIANWYFINGIDYTYEEPYEYDVATPKKRQYIPDFKLKNYPIYHEHYGVDANGEASQFTKKQAEEYLRSIGWKRTTHQFYKTDCIETYSYEFEEGVVFAKLENELRKRNVAFNPLSNEEIKNALDSIYENRTFKSLINLISTFLNLYKATYRDEKAFEELKNSDFRNKYEKNRADLFLDIVKDIYHYYMNHLKEKGKIDFDDMILQSTLELDNSKNYKFKYITCL